MNLSSMIVFCYKTLANQYPLPDNVDCPSQIFVHCESNSVHQNSCIVITGLSHLQVVLPSDWLEGTFEQREIYQLNLIHKMLQ